MVLEMYGVPTSILTPQQEPREEGEKPKEDRIFEDNVGQKGLRFNENQIYTSRKLNEFLVG